MVTNLLFVLRLSVLDDLGYQRKEDVFEELQGEDHLGPIVTLLHNVQHVP